MQDCPICEQVTNIEKCYSCKLISEFLYKQDEAGSHHAIDEAGSLNANDPARPHIMPMIQQGQTMPMTQQGHT